MLQAANLSEEEMEAFLSDFSSDSRSEKETHRESHNFVGAVNIQLEDPSIQALLVLYECLSKGAGYHVGGRSVTKHTKPFINKTVQQKWKNISLTV